MKQIQDIKHLLSSKKYIIMLFAAMVFISCILFMSDIFSYSRSGEAAENKLTVSNGAVLIQEPEWVASGQEMAQHSEPGMLIPKNPYAVNDGNVDIYIRLKMTIKVDKLENCRLKNQPEYKERIDAIADALLFEDENNNKLPLLNKGENNELKSENPSFVLGDGEPENNNNNKERVYYFYYVENNTDPILKSVSPGGQTAELFSYLEIPIYKKDYLGVFDQKFDIILEAEGIPVGKNLKMKLTEETKNLFEN